MCINTSWLPPAHSATSRLISTENLGAILHVGCFINGCNAHCKSKVHITGSWRSIPPRVRREHSHKENATILNLRSVTVYPRLGLSAPGALSHLIRIIPDRRSGGKEKRAAHAHSLLPLSGVIIYPRYRHQFLTGSGAPTLD